MLVRVAPSLFRGRIGETATIAAVPQDNDGVSAAGFTYGGSALPGRSVQGHPGCDFAVAAGSRMLVPTVVFGPNAPGARYDLFEESEAGALEPLGVALTRLTGPIVQIQIDGQPVPAAIAADVAAPAAPGLRRAVRRRPRARKAATKKRAKPRRKPAAKGRRKTASTRRRPKRAAGRRREPASTTSARARRTGATRRTRRRSGR
jgi:hypothetical protein